MKYFLDTEFLEGPQKESFPISLFRKHTPNTIDLISIGIVAEDGREYYAISNEFNLKEAWNRCDGTKLEKGSFVWLDGEREEVVWQPNPEGFYTIEKKIYWIRENVLLPIYNEMLEKWNKDTVYYIGDFSYKNLKYLLNVYGKTNKEIAQEVHDFAMETGIDYGVGVHKYTPIEFYAYYADYDWVVFCWLFGKMMDLPKGFPKYCSDLKQELDSKLALKTNKRIGQLEYDFMNDNTIVSCAQEKYNLKERLSIIKNHPDYPKQENEHDALADARWNKKLYDFLNKL